LEHDGLARTRVAFGASVVAEAAADGETAPGEAASLNQLVANTAVETFEFAERLAKLEDQMAAKGSTP
jgi:hypothetical protein